MEIYILSNIDLSIQAVCKPCNYTINLDEETNGKSEITLHGINGAKKGYYLVINGLHRPFYFLIDDVNAEKGKSVIKISALDISNIFDRKVISKNLDTMTADGIEDFIADTILANFINSSDTILNIDYIDIYIHSHTKLTVDTNEENGLYNFHTFLINCRQNKNIYCDFSIVDKRLKIDIENKVQDTHQIDTTVDEVTNYNKIYDVDVCAKVTVLIREDNSEYNLYLKTDRTTTTNQNDPNRASGRIEVISVDTADKAEEAALNVIKGNQYKHLVEFNIANTSKLVDIKLLDIGTPIKIKTTDDIYDSYISAITINDTQNFVSYKSGNLRIAFIDKIKQEKKDKLGNKLDVSGGTVTGKVIFEEEIKSPNTLTGWNKSPIIPTNHNSQDGMIAIADTSEDLRSIIHRGDRVKYKQAFSNNNASYFPFDEDVVDKISAHNGTATDISYSNNKAVFNGTTSKIVISDHADFHATTFTIRFKIKRNGVGGYRSIFQSSNGGSNYTGIVVEINTAGQVYLVTGNNTGATENCNWHWLIGKTNVCDNVEHTISITFNGNCFQTDRGYGQIYVDGILDAEMEMFKPVWSGTNYVTIGALYSGGYRDFFIGELSDFYFRNGNVLSEETIQELYILNEDFGTEEKIVDKMGIVHKITASQIFISNGTDHIQGEGEILDFYYSHEKNPVGFNTDKAKWRQQITAVANDIGLTGCTEGTWNNFGTWGLDIQLGDWKIGYHTSLYIYRVGDRAILKCKLYADSIDRGETLPCYKESNNGGDTITAFGVTFETSKNMRLNAKTTFRFEVMSAVGIANIVLAGTRSRTIIYAEDNYL